MKNGNERKRRRVLWTLVAHDPLRRTRIIARGRKAWHKARNLRWMERSRTTLRKRVTIIADWDR